MNQQQLDLQDAIQELAALRIHLSNAIAAQEEADEGTFEYNQAAHAVASAISVIGRLEYYIRAQALMLYNADQVLPPQVTVSGDEVKIKAQL
jgi:hypothetical protein